MNKRVLTCAALVMFGQGLAGCGGSNSWYNPVSPSSPPPPPAVITPTPPPFSGEISIAEVVPGSGATLIMRDCGSSINVCTDQLRTTFDVVTPYDVEDAVVIVMLRGGFAECAEWSQRTVLSANTRKSFSTSSLALSVGEDLQPLCRLPIETTGLTVAVYRRLSPARPLLTRELPYRYTLTAE